ncbi:MAG: ImmA/IrrE family metallo-endopeptidase [bacterium]|nr:ImmA/IrrE family metallo-endopeptidase [bacterium]
MQTAVHCAIQTLIDNNIHSLPISTSTIERMIQNLGFKLISYNIPLNNEDIDEFNELGLLEIAKTFKAFTYVDNDYKFVFYRANLSAQDRIYILAHELGHICLGHFTVSGVRCSSDLKSKSPQEIESDNFAFELLAPTCVLNKMRGLTPEKISHITLVSLEDAEHIFFKVKSHALDSYLECELCNMFNKNVAKYNHVINWGILFATFISCIIILWLSPFKQTPVNTDIIPTVAPTVQVQQDLPVITSLPEVSDGTVVVTKSGEKYHKPNCRHVKGRNTFTITTTEAIEHGYEPCKDCF